MVTTHSSTPHNEPTNTSNNPQINLANDPLAQQLSTASRLDIIDTLATNVAALKAQASSSQLGEASKSTLDKEKATKICLGPRPKGRSHQPNDTEEEWENPWWTKNQPLMPYTKMDCPEFEGGDPRGWILKAEIYFHYYQTLDDLKVDILAMYLGGDARDLFG